MNKALRGLLLGLVYGLLCQVAAANDTETQRLVQAHVTERVAGRVTERDIVLPYHWDVEHPGQQGEAEFVLRFNWDLPADEALGLLIPKVGNAYTVRLNGQILESEGDLVHYNGADYSQMPRHLVIAPNLVHASNEVLLRIRADAGRRGGLAPLVIGPVDQTYPEYLDRYHLRSSASLAIAVFSAFVSLIAFSLWGTQIASVTTPAPQRDALYLYAALAELFWSFGTGYILFEHPPVQWPLWGVMSSGSTIFWSVFMSLFCMEVAGWRNGTWAIGFRFWSYLLGSLAVLCTWWSLQHQYPLLLTSTYLVLALNFAGFCVLFIAKSVRHGNSDQRLVALSVVVNVFVGIRDIYVFRIHPSYGEVTWLRYSSVLFGLTLLYILITRFQHATQQSRDLLNTLSQRVAAREQELHNSFAKLELMARQQERTNERSRILRDMHDGVGAHISAAIRQLQSGQSSHELVAQTLKESLDHLKLSIDAMNLVPGDVTGLLANLRYRLSPRFASMAIDLQWEVDNLPLLQGLDANAMRQLQFILYEAFSNALQHSRASCIRIVAHNLAAVAPDDAAYVRVCVCDNGCGFDVSQVGRKGLDAMAARATAIGARLHLSSAAGKTELELLLPLHQPAPASPSIPAALHSHQEGA